MNYSESALQKVREDRLIISEVDQWLYEEINPYVGDRVLEVGCGMGNFADHFVDRELYIGLDTCVESVWEVSNKYGLHNNVRSFVYDVTCPAFPYQFSFFDLDTVFSLNVFEHIEKHEEAIKNVSELLPKGGRFILIVPAHKWLYGEIDKAIGHYRRYNKGIVSGLFELAGFTCVYQKYINLLGAAGWFMSGSMGYQETPPQSQLRLMNKLTPWLKRIERKVPPPMGISVMSVGVKD